jgi:hypothetical protein
MSASRFVWSLVNLLSKPLKCFPRLLENILYAGQQFWNGLHVSGPVEFQLKMTNIQGDQAPAKWQKMLKNSRTHPQRLSPNNPWAQRHCWDRLWSLPGDHNRKFEHTLHCHEVCSLTLDRWSKAVGHKHVSWATRES